MNENRYCECGNEIKNLKAKRCRECYLRNPDKGYSHNYSKRELKKRSKLMSIRRKNGSIKTWNKNKDMWKERPELVINMKNKLKGRHLNPKYEWKKGHKDSLPKRADLINRHHKNLDKANSHPDNLLYLTNSSHNSLHKRAYDYLVKTNQIDDYLEWFIIKFNPKLYTVKEYKRINYIIASKFRSIKGGDTNDR